MAHMNNNPIGIFDSGIGGLTVVKEILKELPSENIIYLGDTARVPYGTRGKEVITKFALDLANFLLKKKVKFLVVSCNTISSICLDVIEYISPVPVLGVIQPAVDEALKTTRSGVIGVIGTPATIASKIYEKKLKRKNPKLKVKTVSCPLFVPLAEEGLINHAATKLVAKEYLKGFKNNGIDTLILGCTHYPILRSIIQQTVGPKVTLIDSAKPTAKKLNELLEEKNLLRSEEKVRHEFFVTDAPERVYKVADNFFGDHLNGKLKEINLPIA
ncbi:glutamate racemase [Candidatus Daviesbacteria bacterium]|nr:glutamate racemase [Candidatus Daviesbacteria bacterium]